MPDGFVYEGQWENGESSGQGVATYANGDVYEGTFLNGRRQGEGTMRYATGEVESGAWQDGALTAATTDPETGDSPAAGDTRTEETIAEDPEPPAD